jgi:outer membrane protein assembly factor BamB
MIKVLTRSYDNARSGANTQEISLTPQNVGSNLLKKHFSLIFNDDPRLEAQPLYLPAIRMNDGKLHDVVFVCTMANNIWAFDANDGKSIWPKPVNLGHPIKPQPVKTGGNEIDMWGVNILWGILSTPVIDADKNIIYIVNWSSPDGTVNNAVHQLHALDIASGNQIHPPITIEATAPGALSPKFIPSRQKQRTSLLLVNSPGAQGGAAKKTLFVGFGMTHEAGDPTHGWLLAYDLDTFRQTAAWCTTPNGRGAGIWQAGQGPAADENGDIYLVTGNYGVQDTKGNTLPPANGDLPESIVKLHYTPPADAHSAGSLAPVAWFTPFTDAVRHRLGEFGAKDNFQDYDFGSGGAVPLAGLNMVVGAGKDGVLYVLDTDTAKFGQGADFAKLKQPPLFFTYFPGFGVDAANVANLDNLFDGKTHHLHGTPAFWTDPVRGPMLFVWGENENLRAWTIDHTGKLTFVAKSAEIASGAMGGKGGMPGGFIAVTSNGNKAGTGIVWTLAPIFGDANKHVVEGILRAYDASNLDPVPNQDGTPRLKLLWDSKHIPGNKFNLSKFCPPVVADGKIFVPTYDGRVDVYGLVAANHKGPLPTNAVGVHETD